MKLILLPPAGGSLLYRFAIQTGASAINSSTGVFTAASSFDISNILISDSAGTSICWTLLTALGPTFGVAGKVLTTLSPKDDRVYGIAIDRQSRIIVVGCTTRGNQYDHVILRYLDNGSLDASFGIDGITKIALACMASAVAIDSNDKIVIAGYSNLTACRKSAGLAPGI